MRLLFFILAVLTLIGGVGLFLVAKLEARPTEKDFGLGVSIGPDKTESPTVAILRGEFREQRLRSESFLHEIEAVLLFLISVVCLSAASVTEGLLLLRRQAAAARGPQQ